MNRQQIIKAVAEKPAYATKRHLKSIFFHFRDYLESLEKEESVR